VPAGRRAVVALLLALVTLAVFLPAVENGFVAVDDTAYVTANPVVQRGLTAEGLRWSLTASVSGHWHPVTLWSHMLDVTLFGPNPRGHHLTSVLLHALNAALVLLVLHALTGAAARSAALAALWALHPLRVESVAWVAERKDVLSGLFFLLTVLAYVRWTRSRRPATYLLCLLLFAAGLMAKSMLVTLPAVLLLLDAWPLARFGGTPFRRVMVERLREKAPHFGLALLFSLATVHFQGAALATPTSFSIAGRFANAVLGAAQYLRASVWPSGLAAMYPIPEVVPWGALAISALVLGAASWLAWRRRSAAPYLLVGWCWFLGVLFPILGLLQAGPQAWADRFSYLPALGLLLAIVWGVADGVSAVLAPRPAAWLLAGALLLALAGETVATRRQIPVWRNDVSLWRHALAVTRENYFAEVNLGAGWLLAGQPAAALQHFREATRLAPQALEAQAGYGEALRQIGDFAAAVEALRRAVALRPEDARVHESLAHALLDSGDRAAAIEELRRAAALAPGDLELEALLRRIESGR